MHTNEEKIGPPGENSGLYIYTSLTRCVANMASPTGAVDSTRETWIQVPLRTKNQFFRTSVILA